MKKLFYKVNLDIIEAQGFLSFILRNAKIGAEGSLSMEEPFDGEGVISGRITSLKKFGFNFLPLIRKHILKNKPLSISGEKETLSNPYTRDYGDDQKFAKLHIAFDEETQNFTIAAEAGFVPLKMKITAKGEGEKVDEGEITLPVGNYKPKLIHRAPNNWKVSCNSGPYWCYYDNKSRRDVKFYHEGQHIYTGKEETIGQGIYYPDEDRWYFATEHGPLISAKGASYKKHGIRFKYSNELLLSKKYGLLVANSQSVNKHHPYLIDVKTGKTVFHFPKGKGIIYGLAEDGSSIVGAIPSGAVRGFTWTSGEFIGCNAKDVERFHGQLYALVDNKFVKLSKSGIGDTIFETDSLKFNSFTKTDDLLYLTASNPDRLYAFNGFDVSQLVEIADPSDRSRPMFDTRVTVHNGQLRFSRANKDTGEIYLLEPENPDPVDDGNDNDEEGDWRTDLKEFSVSNNEFSFRTKDITKASGRNKDGGWEWIIARLHGDGMSRCLVMVMGGDRPPSRIYFNGNSGKLTRNGVFSVPLLKESEWKVCSREGNLEIYLDGNKIFSQSGVSSLSKVVMNGYPNRHMTGKWKV